MSESKTLLSVHGIHKSYGGLKALSDVSLEVKIGEVHALVGENGAGKSTLMKILGGIVKKDSGEIVFKGETVEFTQPIDSIHAGIAIIHQELSMLPHLNVMENIFMGRMPAKIGMVDWNQLEKRTRELLSMVGLDIDPKSKVGDLSISNRQLIEIAKALSINARLIIMDEPNSSLSDAETENLFGVIRELQSNDISVIYVSHKIEEVLEISDRISALRDGLFVGTLERAEASVPAIIQMMVGRDLERKREESQIRDEICLKVEDLAGPGFSGVSFSLRKGEILGFSGLVGAGRSEFARAIFGAEKFTHGTLWVNGKHSRFTSPARAIRAGLAMVPEDRKKLSLFMGNAISFNMTIANLYRTNSMQFLKKNQMNAHVREYIDKLRIKLDNPDFPVSSLSGGNQQKTILARWLSTDPSVLILDEPTHGVDIGAKAEIYSLIHQLAANGLGIILISSEMPEIMTMADRVLVMREGRMSGILEKEQLTEERIMEYATTEKEGV